MHGRLTILYKILIRNRFSTNTDYCKLHCQLYKFTANHIYVIADESRKDPKSVRIPIRHPYVCFDVCLLQHRGSSTVYLEAFLRQATFCIRYKFCFLSNYFSACSHLNILWFRVDKNFQMCLA